MNDAQQRVDSIRPVRQGCRIGFMAPGTAPVAMVQRQGPGKPGLCCWYSKAMKKPVLSDEELRRKIISTNEQLAMAANKLEETAAELEQGALEMEASISRMECCLAKAKLRRAGKP